MTVEAAGTPPAALSLGQPRRTAAPLTLVPSIASGASSMSCLGRIGHTREMVYDESSRAAEREKLSSAATDGEQGQSFGELQYYVPQDILDVSFAVAVRGYDRRAVDA